MLKCYSSNKNNIIVILADGFDGQDFLPVLEEEPDLKQYFDGFTLYEDTLGTSLASVFYYRRKRFRGYDLRIKK